MTTSQSQWMKTLSVEQRSEIRELHHLKPWWNLVAPLFLVSWIMTGIPWYNLPKPHRLLLPEYREANASIYSSYFAFAWDAFKLGIHGRAPNVGRVDGRTES